MSDQPKFRNILSSIRVLGLLFTISIGLQQARAQEKEKNNGDISTEVVAHDKDAIFSGSASFTFTVNNPTGNDQKGTVSYLVTTEKGEKVLDKVQSVKISQIQTKITISACPN